MNWDYLAGFFDGEGNLHTGFIKNKQACQLRIRIYSTNQGVLEQIKEFLGDEGYIYTKKASRNDPNRNLVYEFVILKKEDCLLFLKNIYPYSIIKKEQITYLLENFDFSRGNRAGGHNNLHFDIDKFRSFNTRKNTNNSIKNHTIKSLTE